MKRAAVIVTAALAGIGSMTLDGPDLGASEAAITLPAVVTLDVKTDGPPPSGSEMFGWTPDFSVNVPGFDSLNRAYVRDRTNFMDEIPGTTKRLRFGVWEQTSFESAIRKRICRSAATCKVCYDDAGGEYNAQIVFDRDDRAYTVVHVFTVPPGQTCPTSPSAGADQPPAVGTGRAVPKDQLLMLRSSDFGSTSQADELQPKDRLLMLRSSDFGSTWQIDELPCAQQFALERPYSPEPLEGPPAVLLRDGASAACGTGSGSLTLVKPIISTSGAMTFASAILEETDVLSISSHSGGGTQVITHQGKVYAVWGKRGRDHRGSPVWIAVHDIAGTTLVKNDRRRITWSRPRNDDHNRSALAIETTGHIDVVVGSHGCAFRYLRSGQPLNIGTFPTVPMTTMPKLDPHVCPTELGQTYVSLVRDRFDTLHLVYRLNVPDRTRYLVYQRRPAGSAWETPKALVDPPHAHYSVYYQQLTIDHRGWLYLAFSWYTYWNCEKPEEPEESCAPPGSPRETCCAPGNWFQRSWFGPAQLFKYSSLLINSNGGNSWQLGSTVLFGDATFWEPASGTLADLDGNGLKDVVHVYWDHGLEVHVDAAQDFDGVWQWVTRGRRLPDGAQILERPVLSGNVNAPADDRDDLVYVYGDPAPKIRTQLARADGGFDVVTQSDGTFMPDPAYPLLMGDVTGDGRADIVMPYWSNNCLNIRTKVSGGNGTWTTNTATCVALSRMNQYPVKIGRINNTDVRSDLVFLWRDAAGALKSRVLLAGTSAGGLVSWTATAEQNLGDGDGINQYPHLLGDVNGDGYDDLVFLFRHWDTGMFSVRVKFAQGNGYGWSGSRESQHPDGDQVPHYTPMIGKVDGDACADILLPHRLGAARDGDYQLRTFLAVCDGSKNAQWTRTTTQLP